MNEKESYLKNPSNHKTRQWPRIAVSIAPLVIAMGAAALLTWYIGDRGFRWIFGWTCLGAFCLVGILLVVLSLKQTSGDKTGRILVESWLSKFFNLLTDVSIAAAMSLLLALGWFGITSGLIDTGEPELQTMGIDKPIILEIDSTMIELLTTDTSYTNQGGQVYKRMILHGDNATNHKEPRQHNEMHSGRIQENVLTEAFYAALIGLITFAVAIIARISMAGVQAEELEERNKEIASSTKTLSGTVSNARVFAAVTDANATLNSIFRINQELIGGIRNRPDPLMSLTRLQASMGRLCEHWIAWAHPNQKDPDGNNSMMKSKFCIGEHYINEIASDVARSPRLLVANIRFLTSMNCHILLELNKIASHLSEFEGDEKQYIPIWFGATSFSHELWFEPKDNFLDDVPNGDLAKIKGDPKKLSKYSHILFWGRYLRHTQQIMHNSKTRSIRIFKLGSEDQYKKARSALKSNNKQYSNAIQHGSNGFHYKKKDSPNGNDKWKTARDFSTALIADAVSSIREVFTLIKLKDENSPLLDHRWSTIKTLIDDLYVSDTLDPDEMLNAVEDRYYEIHQKSQIHRLLFDLFDDIHVWELAYLGACTTLEKPAGVKLTYTEKLFSEDSKIEEIYDCSPLEVLLDALFLLYDVKKEDTTTSDAGLFIDQWHPASPSDAFIVNGESPNNDFSWINNECDLHAFGIASFNKDIDISRMTLRKIIENTNWTIAFKAKMSGAIGISRMDFIDQDNHGRYNIVSEKGNKDLTELIIDVIEGSEAREDSGSTSFRRLSGGTDPNTPETQTRFHLES